MLDTIPDQRHYSSKTPSRDNDFATKIKILALVLYSFITFTFSPNRCKTKNFKFFIIILDEHL